MTSDLWGQVLWCSTEGLHGGRVRDALLAETEVCDLDVTVLIQHQVLQLEHTNTEDEKGKS